MRNAKDLSELIYLIYDTVDKGPTAWQAVLDRLFQHVNAHMGSVMHFVNGEVGGLLMGCGERAQQEYRNYYIGKDPWVTVAHGFHIPDGATLEASHELVPDAALRKTEFYQDFGRKVGYGYGFGLGVDNGDGAKVIVSAIRESQPFSEEEFEWLRLLQPHLRQALRLGQVFGERGLHQGILLDTIEELQRGLILTDGAARIILANRAAESIACLNDGILMIEGTLRARTAEETHKLHTRIASVVNRNDAGGIVLVGRTFGRKPWIVNVSPRRAAQFSLARILITDPEAQPEYDSAAMSRLYRFTPAETRIALRLARGERLEHIASELHIRMNTARTHVKRMLSKASVRSQSQLIALLSQLPRK